MFNIQLDPTWTLFRGSFFFAYPLVGIAFDNAWEGTTIFFDPGVDGKRYSSLSFLSPSSNFSHLYFFRHREVLISTPIQRNIVSTTIVPS
jgi:hypothetical protein